MGRSEKIDMHYDGIIIGAATFVIIGLFHPIVIKGEYYFGTSLWPIFAFCGAAVLFSAVYTENSIIRAVLGVTGFTLLWSIIEIFHQAERVRKGWYPKNPRRKK
jgi:hypothetical protein